MQMRENYVNLLIMSLKDGRTDPVKDLNYARDSMSNCSTDMVDLGKDNVKTLSCNRAYPSSSFLDSRCYGILNGEIYSGKESSKDKNYAPINDLNKIKPPPADSTRRPPTSTPARSRS